jgi:hypothetical protein
VALSLLAVPALADDRDDVQATIERAYIEGVHRQRDGELMRSGFHESFTMYVLRDGQLALVGLDDWIGRIESWQADQPELGYETTWRLTELDVTGDAAVARVEVDRDGKLTFTDYLSLYRFEDGWRIVAKLFASHS